MDHFEPVRDLHRDRKLVALLKRAFLDVDFRNGGMPEDFLIKATKKYGMVDVNTRLYSAMEDHPENKEDYQHLLMMLLQVVPDNYISMEVRQEKRDFRWRWGVLGGVTAALAGGIAVQRYQSATAPRDSMPDAPLIQGNDTSPPGQFR